MESRVSLVLFANSQVLDAEGWCGTLRIFLLFVCLFSSSFSVCTWETRLLDLKGLASNQKDLALGIYFPHLKHFLFSAVIHFVSVTGPCLSSRTYHIALADCVVSKNQVDESGLWVPGSPHGSNGPSRVTLLKEDPDSSGQSTILCTVHRWHPQFRKSLTLALFLKDRDSNSQSAQQWSSNE